MSTGVELIRQVAEWLRGEFPEANVEGSGIFDRETFLFRVYAENGKAPELEISQEVLDTNSPQQIVSTLRASDTIERMKRDPTVRIQYFSDGIKHFETLTLQCDHRTYRVVRDERHNVSIFDDADQRLQNTPAQMLVLTGSIFRTPLSDWCRQISQWRGPDQ